MARTSKKKLQVFEDGVLLIDDADSIDFAGAGISGAVVDRDVTETVPGGGSVGTWTIAVVSGIIDGANVTFTLPSTPVAGTPFFLRIGRQPQEYTTDYTRSGTTITYVVAPDASLSTFPHIAEYYV